MEYAAVYFSLFYISRIILLILDACRANLIAVNVGTRDLPGEVPLDQGRGACFHHVSPPQTPSASSDYTHLSRQVESISAFSH